MFCARKMENQRLVVTLLQKHEHYWILESDVQLPISRKHRNADTDYLYVLRIKEQDVFGFILDTEIVPGKERYTYVFSQQSEFDCGM